MGSVCFLASRIRMRKPQVRRIRLRILPVSRNCEELCECTRVPDPAPHQDQDSQDPYVIRAPGSGSVSQR